MPLLSFLIAFLLLIVISIQGFHHNREISSFEQFVEIFPEYTSCKKSELANLNENFRKSKERECLERRSRFNLQLQDVRDHNALNLTWKKEINKFSVMSVYEKMQFLGRTHNFVQGDKSLNTFQSEEVKYTAVNNLPTSIDWRDSDVVTPVKNQGSCGACWAFAAAEAIESFAAIESGTLYELSTEQLTACAPNPQQCGGSGGCGGSTQALAFAYVANTTGLLMRSSYPDTSSSRGRTSACLPLRVAPAVQISGYVTLPINDYSALMNAIVNIGPVTVSLDADALFSYSSGILTCRNRWIINHAVQLVGYGVDPTTATKYWILRNSWGTSFGENGYFRLARSDRDSSNCGLDTFPQYGSACEGDYTPITVCGSCGVLSESSYPIGVSISPTQAPNTRSPTAAPTVKVTSRPTRIPSSSFRTQTPSSAPVLFPTSILPTGAPAVVPSVNPSNLSPSVIPSLKPKRNPSVKPTFSPTLLPPTITPTRVPSSRMPKKNPSPVPTKFPIRNPSFPPTKKPSKYPTTILTKRPSPLPSLRPSISATTTPSYAPSTNPSRFVTAKPSRKPTKRPSETPSTKVPTTLRPSATFASSVRPNVSLFPTGSSLLAHDRTARSDSRAYSVVHENDYQQSDSSTTITVSNKHPIDISLRSKLSSKNSSLVTVHDINNTIDSLKRRQDELSHGSSIRRSTATAKPTPSSSIDLKSRVWIPAPAHTATQAASFLQSSTTSTSAVVSRFGSNVSKLSVDSTVSRRKTPTQQSDIIEARNKKAAEWLHNEKKQVDLRKHEREKSRELAKSIDTQRRTMSQVEATQRVRYQIDMLNADLQQNPLRRTLNKPTADHQQESEPRTSSDETAPNQKEDLDIVLTRESLTTIRVSKEEIRASSDTLIGQMAERFSARKRLSRPMVPRLSKSYVNGQTIFDSRFRYTSDAYPSPSKNRTGKKSKKDSDSGDSDYSSDEKSAAENEPMEQDTKMNENAALMLRFSLHSNKSAPLRDDDGDSFDEDSKAAKKDLITTLAEKELADRREKGRQYLEKRKEIDAKKEEEDKQSAILQQQRRKALKDLNNQVLNKNRKSYLNKVKRNSGDLKIDKLSAENVRPIQSKYSVLTGDIMSSIQPSDAVVGPALEPRSITEEKKKSVQQHPDSVHSTEGIENARLESTAQMNASIANHNESIMESALSRDWGVRRPFSVGSDDLLVVESEEHAAEQDVETTRDSRPSNNNATVVDRNGIDRKDQVFATRQPHSIKGSLPLAEIESQPRLSLSKEPPFTVAIEAKRNFEKVRKVLSDVDRMCSMLHTQTVELEEKLKVRDSVDSFKVDHVRVEPFNINVNVNDIRSSISEKLYSKVFDLFRADPSNNSSLETKSFVDDPNESNNLEGIHYNNPSSVISKSAKNNDSSREDQDSVLMDEYDDRNESMYEQTPAPVPETMYDRNGSSGAQLRFQDNTTANKTVSIQTKSYVPTPFPVGDPFLTQHLGVLADKKDILGKFSDYIDEYKSDYYSEDEQHKLLQESDRNEVDRMPVEMWSIPAENVKNNSHRTPSTAYVREPFPSLRNVGELAGLLRTDFDAQIEKMASFGDERNKSVRYNDAEESEDEFSVVALFAKEYMKRITVPAPPPSQDSPVVDDGIPLTGDIAVEDMGNDTPYVETSDQYSEDAEQEDYLRRKTEEPDQRELQESQTFWNSLLNRPLRSEVGDSMASGNQQTSYENERILHDLQMSSRHQEIQRLETDALKGDIVSPSSAETKPVIKYSAAELRARMVEELRRQEDIFNYTIELAEIQQANSLQAARDLAIQSNTRTEIEIMDLQKRKELELQQLAYENSIAISVANAHLVSEQKNAEQRMLVERLQAELEKNQLQQDFSSLLQQASQISANYETNERLLALDKAIDEDKRSRMQQEYESRHKISDAKASAFAAEVVAKAAVQFRQPTIILSNSEQQTDLSTTTRVEQKKDNRLSDSVYNDEYSVSFDQESLMASSLNRDMHANDRRKPKGMDIIKEGHGSHSSDENSSEIYEEDNVAEQSIMESIATQKVSLGKKRSNITDIDNSYSLPDEVSHDSYGDEINDESIQESNISRNKSALDHSIQSLVSGTNMSHSILSEKLIREKDNSQRGMHKNQSYQSGMSKTISNSSTAAYDDDEFESSAISGQSVQEDIKEESNDSIQEESIVNDSAASLSKRPSTEPPEDDYSSYSDSFASKSLNSASVKSAISQIQSSQSHSQSISEVQSSQSRSIRSQALPIANNLLTDGSEIPENKSLVSVHDTQADLDHALALLGVEDPNSQSLNFDERMIHETLELYKKDMEARLRGQERTYALRLRFVKAKKQHRLNLVSSSTQEEKQKVEDEYEEEKAQLERERWTMNANAYKELRKFKQLQKDLLVYNMSLKDSGKSNSAERAKKLADLLAPELNESDSLSSTGSIQEGTFSAALTKKAKDRTEKSSKNADTTTAAAARVPSNLRQEKPVGSGGRFHTVDEVEEYEDADIASVSEREKSVALKSSATGDESYVNEEFDEYEYVSSRNSTAVKPKPPLKQALSDSTESIKSDVLTEDFDDETEENGGTENESSVRNSLREEKLLAGSVADEIKDSSASVARSLVADTEHSAEYSMAYDSQSHLQTSLEQNDNAASSSKKYVLDGFEEDDSVVQTESSESRTEDIVTNEKDKEVGIESNHDNANKAPLREHVTDHQDSYGSTADYSLDYDNENSASRVSILVNDKAEGPAIAIGATTERKPLDISDEISEEIEEEGSDEDADLDHDRANTFEHQHHDSSYQSNESQLDLKERGALENQDLKDSYVDDDFEDDFEGEEDVAQDPVNQNKQPAVEEGTSRSLPQPVVMDDDTFEDDIPEESIASSEKLSEKGEDDGGDDSKSRLENSVDRSANNEELFERKVDDQQQPDVLQLKPASSILSPLIETTKAPVANAAITALLMDDEIDSVVSEVLEEPEAAEDSFESHSAEKTSQKEVKTPVESPADKRADDYSESAVELSIDKPSNDVMLDSKTKVAENNENVDDDNAYEEEFEDDFDDDDENNEPTPAVLPLTIKSDNQGKGIPPQPSHGSGVNDDDSIAASVPESIEDDVASEKSASMLENDSLPKNPQAKVGFVDIQHELEDVAREYELDLSDVPDPENVVSASSISKLRSAFSSGNMVFDSEQQKWVGDDVSMDGFSDSENDFHGRSLDKAAAHTNVPVTTSQHLNLSTLSEDSEPNAKNLEINISVLSEVSDLEHHPSTAPYKRDQFSVLDDEVLEESEDKTIPWVKPVPQAVIEKVDIAANEFEDNYNESFTHADEDAEFSSDTVEGRLEDLANPHVQILDLKETTKDVPKETDVIRAEKAKEQELQTVDDIISVLFDRMLRDILGTLDGSAASRPSVSVSNVSNVDNDDDDSIEEEEFSSDTVEGPLEYGTVRYDMLIEIPDKVGKPDDDSQLKIAEKKSSLSSLSNFPSPLTSVKSKPTILELASAKDLDDLYEFDYSGDNSYVVPTGSPIAVRTEPVEVSTLGIQDQDSEPSENAEKRSVDTSQFWGTMVEATKTQLSEIFETIEMDAIAEKLLNPVFKGSFIDEEQAKVVSDNFQNSNQSSSLSCDLLLDRINEICTEMHSMRHGYDGQTSGESRGNGRAASLSKKMLAQHMPLHQTFHLCEYITSRIASEQQSLVQLLRGEKAMHDHMLNVRTVDELREEMTTALHSASCEVADGILARLLIQTTSTCMRDMNLSEEQIQKLILLSSSS